LRTKCLIRVLFSSQPQAYFRPGLFFLANMAVWDRIGARIGYSPADFGGGKKKYVFKYVFFCKISSKFLF